MRGLAEPDDELSGEDAELLVESAEQAMAENPKTKVGAMRMKENPKRAGAETADAMRDTLRYLDLGEAEFVRLLSSGRAQGRPAAP